MSIAIIPSRNHNDMFLNENINENNDIYIEEYFSNNYYYKEFICFNTNSLDDLFIKSKYFIINIYYILVEKILCEDYHVISLVYLERKQLQTLINLIFKLNSSSNMFLSILDYLETLKMTQLIYLKQNINFKKMLDIPFNKLCISSDKIYNIYNIKDMNKPMYNNLYYENIPINDINLLSRTKTKKDYIKKFYLTNNYYSIKENIIDYIKYCFEELYLDLSIIHNFENIQINRVLFSNLLHILSENNEWTNKLKWFLYYLEYDKLIQLDK